MPKSIDAKSDMRVPLTSYYMLLNRNVDSRGFENPLIRLFVRSHFSQLWIRCYETPEAPSTWTGSTNVHRLLTLMQPQKWLKLLKSVLKNPSISPVSISTPNSSSDACSITENDRLYEACTNQKVLPTNANPHPPSPSNSQYQHPLHDHTTSTTVTTLAHSVTILITPHQTPHISLSSLPITSYMRCKTTSIVTHAVLDFWTGKVGTYE